MKQEKNEDKKSLQEKNQPSAELKNEESQTKNLQELSPEEMKSQAVEKNRIIFLALLDSAMRYREGYFREEQEDYKNYLEGQVEVKIKDAKDNLGYGKTLNERGTRRKIEKHHEELLITFKNKKERFNANCYKEIESIVNEMPPAYRSRFDNYATGFGLMCEELLQAKNTSEILTVCKLYNQGMMDNTFAEIRKQREEATRTGEAKEDADINSVPNGIVTVSGLPNSND